MELINISRSPVKIIEIYQFHLERILSNHSAFFYSDSMFLDIQEMATVISPSMKPFLDVDFDMFENCHYHKYLEQVGKKGFIRKIAVPFMESQEVIDAHLSENPEQLYVSDARNMFFNGLIYGETEQELQQRQLEWGKTVEDVFNRLANCICLMDEDTKEKFVNDKNFRLEKIMFMLNK
ncbi:hypothetical protein [Photobacterium damselae]|uniref:hypothetical protein n=1 Tax=Photobacterium damselae TaxID=38293 RepID=UPI004068F7EB